MISGEKELDQLVGRGWAIKWGGGRPKYGCVSKIGRLLCAQKVSRPPRLHESLHDMRSEAKNDDGRPIFEQRTLARDVRAGSS